MACRPFKEINVREIIVEFRKIRLRQKMAHDKCWEKEH